MVISRAKVLLSTKLSSSVFHKLGGRKHKTSPPPSSPPPIEEPLHDESDRPSSHRNSISIGTSNTNAPFTDPLTEHLQTHSTYQNSVNRTPHVGIENEETSDYVDDDEETPLLLPDKPSTAHHGISGKRIEEPFSRLKLSQQGSSSSDMTIQVEEEEIPYHSRFHMTDSATSSLSAGHDSCAVTIGTETDDPLLTIDDSFDANGNPRRITKKVSFNDDVQAFSHEDWTNRLELHRLQQQLKGPFHTCSCFFHKTARTLYQMWNSCFSCRDV